MTRCTPRSKYAFKFVSISYFNEKNPAFSAHESIIFKCSNTRNVPAFHYTQHTLTQVYIKREAHTYSIVNILINMERDIILYYHRVHPTLPKV